MTPTKESWSAWSKKNNVPKVPVSYREEWNRLSEYIKYWTPDFGVGDYIVVRPGTLGNMDGRAPRMKVQGFFWSGSHLRVLLEPPYEERKFVTSVYVKA